LDTRYLRSLLSVVDTGSIAEAARVEGLTSAAVGQRIQALERQLGVALLSRARHTARPTEACLNLVPRARHIVREAARLAADIDPGGVRGTLRVGAISTALTGLMPDTLRKLTADTPGIKPVIVPGTSRELYEAVADGSLDAALLVAPPFALPKTLRATILREEPLTLLTPLQGPYSLDDGCAARDEDGDLAASNDADRRTAPPNDGRPVVDLAARLQSLPYVRYDPQAWGGRHPARWLDGQGLAPPIVCDLDALETIVMLVSDGVGFSLLPRWQGIERLAHGCRLTPLNADSGARGHREPSDQGSEDKRTGRDHYYARRIVLLQAIQPDRPRMLAALAHALGQDGDIAPETSDRRASETP
jgi:DNA-binding transcriptional LysR family regulator